MKTAYIYKVTNLLNNKVYIGQHDGSKPAYYASGSAIKRAIRKYGKAGFVREILVTGDFTKEELDALEVHYIDAYQSYAYDFPDKGYNLTKGGMGKRGALQSAETKRQQRLNCFKRRGVVQLTLAGEYVATYFCGLDAAKAIDAAGSGIVRCCQGTMQHVKGYRWVYEEEYNPATIQPLLLKTAFKAVGQYDSDGQLVSTFSSAGEAAKAMGVSRGAIANNIARKSRLAAGYAWRLL